MRADFKIFIDACVLANFGVCDLLLRLAEKPRQYLPAWSEAVLAEVYRVQTEKLKRTWPPELAIKFGKELRATFPEAMSSGYEHLLPSVTNDPKDHHVLAAAIHAGASIILTFNLRDFPDDSLAPWGIKALHPQAYLLTLYDMDPQQVMNRVVAIAARRGKDPEDVPLKLGTSLPEFTARLLNDLP